MFYFLGSTPINPGPTTPVLHGRFEGDFTFQLDPSLNDPSHPTTVPFVNFTGIGTSEPPTPANLLPSAVSPNLQFLGGELTNIVRDGSGHVVSADVSDISSRWYLQSLASPVELYTQVGLPFSATGVTIPFKLGTVIEGDATFPIYLNVGTGDMADDILVGYGDDRTLTAVPEPSSFILIGVAAGAILIGLLLHRNARQRATLEPVCQPVSE
jgi:hypothetical protein